MKTIQSAVSQGLIMTLLILFSLNNCSGGDSNPPNGGSTEPTPQITIGSTAMSFGEVTVSEHSEAQNLEVFGTNLLGTITISASVHFEVSLNNSTFSNEISINGLESTLVFVRFSPQDGAIGTVNGTLTLQSTQAANKTVSLTGIGLSNTPTLATANSNLSFGETEIFQHSDAFGMTVTGQNLIAPINLNTTDHFEISLDNATFGQSIQIPTNAANGETTVYVRFSPTDVGNQQGTLTLTSTDASEIEVALSGVGAAVVHNYETFQDQPLGFGGGFNQSASQVFTLHDDVSNIQQIKMFLQIDCPSTGCDDWDRFANVKVKDPETNTWFEIGRYITPYWVGTQQLERGLEFDVTDFKGLLTGAVELRIYIENWTAKADLVSIDFDFVEGTPDYPYYAVSEVLGYHSNSISGVPYGVSHNLDLNKSIQIPANAESSHLRTIISGWGHATPNDADGRPCAEWCYRTHDIKINGVNTFQHSLDPIGCASNPVSNQNPGNWMPDRAGWCPGMAVPVRTNVLDANLNGSSLTFEYDFEDWTSDGGNGNAFYATSTYVVVKSNTAIVSPVVTD